MVSRRVKSFFYSVMGPLMFLNALRYRWLSAPRQSEEVIRVHLGPGKRNYLPGWINVDANLLTAKLDVWADLTHGLPFREDTIDAFYSHHVVEHLPDPILPKHFAELYRCLKPGGVIRIGVPNADAAIRKYIEGDSEWFGDFPDSRTSIGGRLANMLLCRGEHLTILTPSYFEEIANSTGFVEVAFAKPVIETNYPEIFDNEVHSKEWEKTPDFPHTLILEAMKPI